MVSLYVKGKENGHVHDFLLPFIHWRSLDYTKWNNISNPRKISIEPSQELAELESFNYLCSINVRQCSLSFQRTSSNIVHTRNMRGERQYSLPFGRRHPHAVERAVRAVNTSYSCSKNRLFMPSSTWHPTGSHMQAQGMPCGRRRDAIWGMPSAFLLYQLAAQKILPCIFSIQKRYFFRK